MAKAAPTDSQTPTSLATTEHRLEALAEDLGRRLGQAQNKAARWLEQGQPAEAAAREVLTALEAEADGGPPTGLEATRTEEGLVIRHLYAIAAGRSG